MVKRRPKARKLNRPHAQSPKRAELRRLSREEPLRVLPDDAAGSRFLTRDLGLDASAAVASESPIRLLRHFRLISHSRRRIPSSRTLSTFSSKKQTNIIDNFGP